MKFYNKAETLKKLNIKNAKIPRLIFFKVSEFIKKEEFIIQKILNNFSNEKIIIRSCSIEEDNYKTSNAGKFESVVNVDLEFEDIRNAIHKVIKSYNKNTRNRSLIIAQKMITYCDYSGVMTTCNLKNYSPYYVINYTNGSDTTLTTSGQSESSAYYQFKYSEKGASKYKKLIKLAKELEIKFKNEFLDIEFGFKKGQIYLFQVRPIIIKNKNFCTKYSKIAFINSLKKLSNKVTKLKRKHYNLYGNTTFFGVMPDWNPAEIIGTKPHKLSASLYQELITDYIWAKNRTKYEFNNVTSNHLMTMFLGTPFIDLRVDFNSWIPKILSESTKKKLVNYYLKRFKENLNLHDKIEFEILFTCFNADTINKINGIPSVYLNKKEKKDLVSALKSINKKAFNLIDKEFKNIEILKNKQTQVQKSNMYSIDKIYWYTEDCKKFGTEPFAGLARSGFIAIELLNSFVKNKYIKKSDKEKFMQNLSTITNQMMDDINLPKQKFCNLYGHLRPSTYDLLSPNYKENYNIYFKNKKVRPLKKIKKQYNFSKESRKKINKFLKENFNGLISVNKIISFISKGIKYREYSKFIFSKSIDLIFEEIKFLSKRHKIKLKDMVHLDIKTILSLYYNLDNEKIKEIFLKDISKNYVNYKFNELIVLPQVITNENDIYFFEEEKSKPNYFGQKSQTGELLYLNKKDGIKNLKDKIICINSADPGFDFIFNHKIKGLITEFGGSNSHMSIRCAELNIPSIIGIGSVNFNKIIKSNKISIDPNVSTWNIIK